MVSSPSEGRAELGFEAHSFYTALPSLAVADSIKTQSTSPGAWKISVIVVRQYSFKRVIDILSAEEYSEGERILVLLGYEVTVPDPWGK